jgi:inhibitor of cysteine peptidase
MILCLAVAGAVIAGGCLSADEKSPDLNDVGMSSFTSEKEMLKYFENRSVSGSRFLSSYGGSGSNDMAVDAPAGVPAPEAPATMEASDNSKAPDYSKTNVQIAGVDEADIIKTDGKIIYYTPNLHYPTNITEHTDSKYPYYTYDTYQITLVINAMPAATASIISQIKETGGNLYLADDLLIVIKTGMDNQIVAYDISDPVHPKVMWEQAYEGYYTDSRLIGDKLYFISGDYGFGLLPITYMGKELVYTDFYYPGGPDIIRPAADNTYYVTKMDVKTGSVEDTKVFISSYRSIFFVSADNLYLTNHYYPDTQLMFLNFVESNGSDYLLAETMQYIKKVMGYDLSSNIKYMAVSEAINNYTSGLTGDENTAFSDSFYEDYNAYSSALIIEAEKTTITKINLETFNVVSGVVPGRINDKFSMDEKDGYLRVISSVGDDYRTDESTLRSMVSVLSSEMETVGTLDNVAAGEYVQTTRYVGNTLYLMTYAENDPFLLIDLSNPESPSVLGEMRLQGTYNYIYPISDTLLVGFGYTGDWRDMRTKLSLYDVSNPQNPIELDVFYFNNDEYVSVYDYRGFTWNAAKNLMIVSGSNTAYVFEIKENQITLMKEDMHEGGYITRSAYVGNYLYVFSDAEIHVYDMANWQRVQVISIEQPVYPEYGTIYPIHDEPVYAAQA